MAILSGCAAADAPARRARVGLGPPSATGPDAAPAEGDPDAHGFALAAGGAHTCVRRPTGNAVCWGANAEGQLGRGAGSENGGPNPRPAPVEGLRNLRHLALGGSHSCAITDEGHLYCWGSNYSLQIGKPQGWRERTPNPVPTPVEGAPRPRRLALGDAHSCALTEGGRAYCWGDNEHCTTGRDDSQRVLPNLDPTPAAVAGLHDTRQLSLGGDRSCALAGDGRVLCWGFNGQGQLGRPSRSPNDMSLPSDCTPWPVAGLAGIRQVALGYNHQCAVTTEGRVLCWGGNFHGQLGHKANNRVLLKTFEEPPNPVPKLVEGLYGVRQVALGLVHSCALTNEGRVLCWGDNELGQLGHSTHPDSNGANPEPALVEGLSGVRAIALGGLYSCALADAGRVFCWGENLDGQLGNPANSGVMAPNPQPLPVVGMDGLRRTCEPRRKRRPTPPKGDGFYALA